MPNLNLRLKRLRYGVYTAKEMLLFIVDGIRKKIFHQNSNLYVKEHVQRLLHPSGGTYHIKDIRLPILDTYNERVLAASMFDDDYYSYLFCGDDYSEKVFDECDKFLAEGLYGLVNDKVNVTVKPGDIVIDAGSWIGDFAAYASVKGAVVYAFEPIDEIFKYLVQTAELNKNIIPVKKGLSGKSISMDIFLNDSSTASFMRKDKQSGVSVKTESVSLDDFIRENNIQRVDFIKADIEGFERHMLEGAQETLKRFAPKLALCTYHLPDDPQVMAELILKANPKYNIVQKRMKLFASVPE